MQRKYPRIILTAAALLFFPLAQPGFAKTSDSEAEEAAPDTEPQIDRRAAAIEDIEGAYAIFARHHPGMYDPNNPEFPALLARARAEALAFAENVTDHQGHMLAMRTFSRVLSDGHARAQIGYSGKSSLWPGFAAEWRGDALYITEPGENGPPLGAALISCDGVEARAAIRQQTFAFRGRPDEAGQWWFHANGFFSRPKTAYLPLPKSCTFRHRDGAELTYDLEWSEQSEARFWEKLEKAKRAPVGLTQPRDGIQFITLSTFAPGPDGQAQYETLFDDLDARQDQLGEARAIVIDLRRNGGGSSTWSYRVAKKLWGEAAVDWAMTDYFRDTETWHLADDANIAHFANAAKTRREHGMTEIADLLDEISANLAAARDAGETFAKERIGEKLFAEASPTAPRTLPPVYVITDGGCVSACLDALDVFTRFPGVKLVGAPTSADTEYLEIRFEPLPSDRGAVILPTKIWFNRPRGSGEVYEPDILVTDLEWTTEVMLDHIEADLAS